MILRMAQHALRQFLFVRLIFWLFFFQGLSYNILVASQSFVLCVSCVLKKENVIYFYRFSGFLHHVQWLALPRRPEPTARESRKKDGFSFLKRLKESRSNVIPIYFCCLIYLLLCSRPFVFFYCIPARGSDE